MNMSENRIHSGHLDASGVDFSGFQDGNSRTSDVDGHQLDMWLKSWLKSSKLQSFLARNTESFHWRLEFQQFPDPQET